MTVREGQLDDRADWDHYVTTHANASPYHLMGWCIAVEKAYGHQPYFLLSKDHDRINGVLPLCLLKTPIAGSLLCSLPFCDLGGWLADNDGVERDLTEHALKLAEQLGAALQIRTRTVGASQVSEESKSKVSMLLDLPASSNELAATFKSKLRSQIRKAEKNNLVFSYGSGAQERESFYRVFAENMRDLGSPVHSDDWFEELRQNLHDNMIIGLVSFDNLPVGAGIVLVAGRSAAIPWASTLSRYNHLAPNMLLYWNLLKTVTDMGCTRFDFGRSTFGEGTFRFKRQWGAHPVELQWREYDPHGSFALNLAQAGLARRTAESCWKRLPLPVANAIGPRIRRYTSL